mmetsp:Transcript_97332/g.172314  ORF Transcript_97332/g.172314 Transcript_97332/m.172314 type:complete len:555 (-) Transcript_97332:78-1742(-)
MGSCCAKKSRHKTFPWTENEDLVHIGVSQYLPTDDWSSPMGIKSLEKTRVEYVLMGWQERLPEFFENRAAEYTVLPPTAGVAYKQSEAINSNGIRTRHDYIEPEKEFIATHSKQIKSTGNPWGLTYKEVSKAVKANNALPVLQKLGLDNLFTGDQDFGLQDDGFLGRRRKELHDEGSLKRYGFVAALVTFLEIMMLLEPPNPKVLKKALSGGQMKELASAGWFLLGTLEFMHPLWQDLIAVGEFRLQGLGTSLKKATENLLASAEGREVLQSIPNLSPKRPLRADDYGLHFMPFEAEWSPGKVERFAKASALMVVCAAELCDAEYQARVQRIVDKQNSSRGKFPAIQHTPAPPKKFDRMMNKHGSVMSKNDRGIWFLSDDPQADHGTSKHPRAACNVDTVRCGLTCVPEVAPALHRALGNELGTRVRTKNNLLADDKAKEDMFYYLAILDNYDVSFAASPEPDGFKGVTHGDVAAALRKKGQLHFRDEESSLIETCHMVAHYLEENHKDVPVRVMCETQIILPMYLEGRKRSHLPYKIVRCHSADELRRDLSSL